MADQDRLRTAPFQPGGHAADSPGGKTDGRAPNGNGPVRATANGTAGEGPGEGGGPGERVPDGARAPGRGWRPPSYSAKLALIPLGLAVAIFLIFGVVAATQPPSGGNAPSTPPAAQPVAGGLRAVSGGQDFHPSGGAPPKNIVAAVRVPAGSAPGPVASLSKGVGSYDSQVPYSVAATPLQVVSFFERQIPAAHWRILSNAPASDHASQQIIGQQSGGDGFYWDMRVTVDTVAPNNATAASPTTFAVRLLQVQDQE